MALPANVSFGTVTGRFLTATADSPTDTDRDPEGSPATDLSIRFAPNVTPAVVRDASATPPTIFALAEIPATVGASGDLIGADGQPGIRLVATTGTTIDPSGWTWKVTLSSPTFPALSFSFSLDPGQTIDLASVVQVPASPGATLAAWLQAVQDANAAADRAEAAAAAGGASDATIADLVTDPATETGTALAARYLPKRVGAPALRPVTWRANHLGAATYLAPGDVQHASFRAQHMLIPGLRAGSIRLLYANHVGTETGWPAITVSAHVESDNHTYPVLFGGSRTVAIPPGGYVLSDAMALSLFQGGALGGVDYLFTMTYVSTPAGGRIPLGIQASPNNGEGSNVYSGGADLTVPDYFGNPTPRPTDGGGMYSPTAILGIEGDPRPAVCIMGDSISIGAGDGGPNWPGGNPAADFGYIARALQTNGSGPRIPYLYYARYGETAATASDGRNMRAYVLDYCTDVVEEYGSNDVNNNSDAVSIQRWRARLWMAAAARGKRVWATTTTPRSTSSDGWATVDGQAKHPNDAARTAVNDWIRGGAPLNPSDLGPVPVGTAGALVTGTAGHPLTGYFEIADEAESGRNSGLWRAGYTADGVHPNAGAHGNLSTAINPAVFTISD